MYRSAAIRAGFLVAVLVGIPGATVAVVQQAPVSTQAAQKPPDTWKPVRTPWGHPDLQGMWTSTEMMGVPLERAKALGDRQFFTDEEVAKRQAEIANKKAELEAPGAGKGRAGPE